MPRTHRRIVLASRPEGAAAPENFRLEEVATPSPGEGEVLVRHRFLTVDPYMRMRMNDAKSYAAPQALSETMGGGAAGEVVESRHPDFRPGDTVTGPGGWQECSVLPGRALRKVDATLLPLETYLGPAGMPGVTAWYGTLKLIAPKPGETVLVSAAAGAVGSIAGQLARAAGARVVGVAGGPAKCRHVTEELGFDACVDYKSESFNDALKSACADGIDGIFENVGGAVLDSAMRRLNAFARIALCGLISGGYGARRMPLADVTPLLTSRARIQGFIISDHQDLMAEALSDLATQLADGRLKWHRTVAEGLENTPSAFLGMLAGQNLGKQLIRLA
ncbi:MAG TPA: NADP-dependent oxidoreductase [Acetobacteraceae bacterium]